MADVSQGSGEPGGASRRSKRKAPEGSDQDAPVPERKHFTRTTASMSNAKTPASATTAASKSVSTTFMSQTLANQQLAKAALDDVGRLSNRPSDPQTPLPAVPPGPAAVDRNIEHLLNSQPDLNRGYTPNLEQIETGLEKARSRRWLCTVVDPSGSIRYFGTERCSNTTRATADATCRGLANFINRWPNALDLISAEKYKAPAGRSSPWKDHFILRAARVLELGTAHVPVRATAPKYRTTKDNSKLIAVKIWTFDPVTLLPVSTDTNISTNHVTTDTVADLPDGVIEFTNDNGNTWRGKDVPDADGNLQFHSDVPDDLPDAGKARFKLLERLGRRVLYELHGKVMDKATVKSRVARIIDLHGGKQKVQGVGIMQGAPLFKLEVDWTSRVCHLFPTGAAVSAGADAKTDISLPTVNLAWLSNVAETLEHTYERTGDMAATWAAGARVADTNRIAMMDGEKPPTRCECAPGTMQDCEGHGCTGCLKGTICSSRVRSSTGLWICRNCAARAAISSRRSSNLTFVEMFLRQNLRTQIWQEARAIGLDMTSTLYLNNLDDCREWLHNTASKETVGNQWTSEMTQQTYTLSEIGGTSVASKGYDDPSVDAIFPYAANYNKWFIHAPSNLWIVEQALNYGKNIQLPIFMVLVAYNLAWQANAAKGITSPTADERAKLERRIVKVATRFRKIRIKATWSRKGRVRKPFKIGKLASDKQEWISGKLRPNEPGPWDNTTKNLSIYGQAAPSNRRSDLSAHLLDRVFAKARAIAAEYGVTLPEQEGVPYFCHEASMPAEWGRVLAVHVMASRWWRMKEYCNVKDVTEDTPWTIYIFCVIVKCIVSCDVPKDDPTRATFIQYWKDIFVDFLELPDVLECHNGLRFSIGHNVHGRQMLTGVNPTTLEWEPARCNILKETTTSNSMKHNYPAIHYPSIKKMATRVNLEHRPDIFDESVEVEPRTDAEEVYEVDPKDVIEELGGDGGGNPGDVSEDEGGAEEDVAEGQRSPEL